jgi:membrane-associated protease RseP (regulator of RpoE activity)
MTGALVGLLALAIVTAVHELGHLVAARSLGARVVSLSIGLGPRLFGFVRQGTRYTLRLLPVSGRVEFERPDSDGVKAAIAGAGIAANLLFGFLLLWATAAALGPAAMPAPREATTAFGYAVSSSGDWLAAVPRGVSELLRLGAAPSFAASVRGFLHLLGAGEPPATLYLLAALSITWAMLNLIPLPLIRTDGWHLLVAGRRALFRGVRRWRR